MRSPFRKPDTTDLADVAANRGASAAVLTSASGSAGTVNPLSSASIAQGSQAPAFTADGGIRPGHIPAEGKRTSGVAGGPTGADMAGVHRGGWGQPPF
mmetsp:Transcript_34153/g.94156  ORF Transcript_34153/g.94156 Transcript_34153/m.94156 type:complete len:98 (+) Transcript_34153:1188-1481(+)